MAIWSILRTFGVFFDHLVIWWQFDIFSPVLVYCVKKKSGKPAQTALFSFCLHQGDQILRIFAQWVIVYFGQLIDNY
jgi:hypothetical protein